MAGRKPLPTHLKLVIAVDQLRRRPVPVMISIR